MKPRVAFIFSQFPCYDEVFILREMVELNRLLDITIFSLKKSHRDPIRHSLSLPLLDKTVYSSFFSRKIFRSNLRCLRFHPQRYLQALLALIQMSWADAEMCIKSLAIFPQAIFWASECEKNKIEHVHGQWATYPAASAMVISTINGIPFSFTGHAHDIYVKARGLRARLKRASFVLTCTEQNKRYLSQVAPEINPDKIKVIHHGVDLAHYRLPEGRALSGEEEEAGRPHPFHILSVGSLFECKGFEYLIAACALLLREGWNFRCRLVGGGYLEEKLKQMVVDFNLQEYVEFTGYQAQEIMPRHYRWGDLLILPAVLKIHWGIPNVLLEALAVGVPVACTPLPSLPELLENPACGFVIPEKNPRAIADLVIKVSQDLDLLKRYGREGRRKIEEQWDNQKTSREIAELFSGQKYCQA